MSNTANFPLLSLIMFTPLVGAVLLLFVSKPNAIRWIANGFAMLGFLVSLPLWFWLDTTSPDWQFVERHEWIPSIGAEYFIGVDGFSALLILLATLMGAIAVLSSWTAITERLKEYYIFLLLLQTGMIGAFVALDFLLFFVFWEVMLVPMYFLIGIWGSANRLYSAIKFFLFTLVGSVIMLLGILAVYFYNYDITGVYTFDITRFHELNMPFEYQWWVFLAFFLGFAVKVPMFPFHTWLPDAHTDAPTAGSVILAAVLLKMGTYGFIRFSLPILPEATLVFVPWVVGLSIVGIIYGALVAMVQPDMKKLVAYSSVAHMGFVLLGIFALTVNGLQGGLIVMISHGISTGALFLLLGMLYERRHTRKIEDFGGIGRVAPLFATVFVLTALASIGLPGTSGFVGEFLALLGVFETHPTIAIIATLGVIFAAYYMLPMVQKIFFNALDKPENREMQDLSRREMAILAPLCALMIWIGWNPTPILERMEPSVRLVLERVQAAAPAGTLGSVLEPGSSVVVVPAPADLEASDDLDGGDRSTDDD